MSHGLATIDGKHAMFYHGEAPWHKHGTRLKNPPTSKEAIIAASLNWTVEKVPLHIKCGRKYHLVDGKYATVRVADSHKTQSQVLGIVGKTYVPLQNVDAFGWFDSIVGQEAAIYETAGALGVGERVWILAKLPTQMRVIGDDVVDKYLLLSNSHDGSSGVQVKFTPIRVVCQNTLTMALRDGTKGIKIHHTASIKRNLQLAQVNLGLINERFKKIEATFKRMRDVSLTDERLSSYLERVFPMPPDSDDDSGRKRTEVARTQSRELFEVGLGNAVPGVKGTLWAAYNGVAEYVDHHMGRRTTSEGRLDSAWFGSGFLTKVRAYRQALDLAASWRN